VLNAVGRRETPMNNRKLRHAAIGLGVPFLACLALVPFRDSMANTNAALVLALIIVAVADTAFRGPVIALGA
jgi:hypothetical protein